MTSNNTLKGTLDQGNLTVSLNGVTLSPYKVANFTTGVDHILTLTAIGAGNSFAGLLFRLGGNANTTKALQVPTGDTDLQVAKVVCVAQQGVGGVTHTNNDGWSKKSIVLRLDEDAVDLPLDVTVVIQNDDVASIWYYSAYTLNAMGGNVTTVSTTSSNSSLVGNNTTSTTTTAGTQATTTTTTTSNRPSKFFIVSLVLLGTLCLISFMSMLSPFGSRRDCKTTTTTTEDEEGI